MSAQPTSTVVKFVSSSATLSSSNDAEVDSSVYSPQRSKEQILPISWNQGDFVLEKPEDVTAEVLNQFILQLNAAASDHNVTLVKTVRNLGKVSAILSQVVEMIVEYEIDDSENDTNDVLSPSSPQSELWMPTKLIIKFFKPSISMTEDMFRVEGNFYQQMTRSCDGHPFWIPRALCCSPTCIILEKVLNVIKYNLLESCPTERIGRVIEHLARFHAFHWKDHHSVSSPSTSLSYSWPFPHLSQTAGMGASMPGPDKARYFVENYSEFCQHLVEQKLDVQRASLEEFCRQLAESSRVLDIHDSVYMFTPTLIHGDFHVGNMLFANISGIENVDDDKNVTSPIWLLDWATCGQGNPLCDFVFFWVVSTNDSDARTMIQHYLPLYYDTLMKSRRGHDKPMPLAESDQLCDFTYAQCLFMARTCLIHQFILLVCYDTWTRNFLLDICNKDGDDATLQFYQQHFDNVNRRCALAVLSDEAEVLQRLFPGNESEDDPRA